MKFLILLLALGTVALDTRAQTQNDSTAAARPHLQRVTQDFIDKDCDGLDDRMAGTGKAKRRGKDRFIDRDNDGICDDRASGLGFRRGGGAFSGTSGTGKGKGPGGKR